MFYPAKKLNSVWKLKEKIKEWKFEKYLSAEESRFIATKVQAREGEGKGTTFYKNGMVIDQRRIEKSAKRKREKLEEMEPSAVGMCNEKRDIRETTLI
jgi:hypothetical protein